MATRNYRLAEFSQAPPPPNKLLQVLAEDHSGTYVLPFPCEWRDGTWHNPKSSKPLDAKIVGWRSRLRKAVSDLTLDKLILQEAARGNY